MCIIVTQDPKKSPILPPELIKYCAKKNPDGQGIMYAKAGKLHLQKQMHDIDGFYKKYVQAYNQGEILHLHFRIGTSGKKNITNAHPHFVTPDIGLMHNGVLGRGEDGDSDTRIFIKEILRNLPDSWFDNSAIVQLLIESIGSDKIVLQRSDGHYWCLNEEKGTFDKTLQAWFSNYSYTGWNAPITKWNRSEKGDRSPKQWDKKTKSWVPMKKMDADEGWELFTEDVIDTKPPEWPYFWDMTLLCGDCIPFSAWVDDDNPVQDWEMEGDYACDICNKALRWVPVKEKDPKIVSIEELRAGLYA